MSLARPRGQDLTEHGGKRGVEDLERALGTDLPAWRVWLETTGWVIADLGLERLFVVFSGGGFSCWYI